MDFTFKVIRLWKIPADDLLNSALATVPLAVLGKLAETLHLEDALADVIQRLEQRLQQEASGNRAERLRTAAYILTGLRLPKPEDVSQLFRGVSIAMRESVTLRGPLLSTRMIRAITRESQGPEPLVVLAVLVVAVRVAVAQEAPTGAGSLRGRLELGGTWKVQPARDPDCRGP
jgi:hypothetical protein